MNIRLINITLLGISMILCGCSTTYNHEAYICKTAPFKSGQYTVTPSFSATAHGKIGSRTGSPYKLTLVIDAIGKRSGVVQVKSAIIRDGGVAVELINEPKETVFMLHHYGQPNSYMNVTIPPRFDLGFEEGKELYMDLYLIIHEGAKNFEIKEKFKFIGTRSHGTTRFNPIFDVT